MSFNPTNEELLAAFDESDASLESITTLVGLIESVVSVGIDPRNDAGTGITAWNDARNQLGEADTPGRVALSNGLTFATEIYALSVIAGAPLSFYGLAEILTKAGVQLVVRGAAAGEPWAVLELASVQAYVQSADDGPEIRRIAAEYGLEL